MLRNSNVFLVGKVLKLLSLPILIAKITDEVLIIKLIIDMP